MSSGEIMGQIEYCQAQMNGLSVSVAALKKKIGRQEDAYSCCNNTNQNFLDELEHRTEKAKIINSYQSVAVFSARYQEKANEILPRPSWQAYYETLRDVEAEMNTEIKNNCALLEDMQQKYQCLENNLATLQANYNQALADEEAERQRQAAAAAAAAAAAGNR